MDGSHIEMYFFSWLETQKVQKQQERSQTQQQQKIGGRLIIVQIDSIKRAFFVIVVLFSVVFVKLHAQEEECRGEKSTDL